jgi:hypothetical protein
VGKRGILRNLIREDHDFNKNLASNPNILKIKDESERILLFFNFPQSFHIKNGNKGLEKK